MRKRKKLQLCEDFIIRFNQIKQYCERQPRNVKRCYQGSTESQEIVRHFYYFLIPEIERDMAMDPRKETSHSIDGFAEQWEEYQKNWANEMELAWMSSEDEQWLDQAFSELDTSEQP